MTPGSARPTWVWAVVIVLILAGLVLAASLVPLAQWTTELAARARSGGAVVVILFLVAYVVACVAFLPASILTLAAGFAYGPLWGLALASPASVAGATLAFLLGRTLLHGWASRMTRDSPRVEAIRRAAEREGFKIVLLLRLSPLVPFNALNYALSLSHVRLGTYVAASAIGMLPATALYAYLGSLAPTAAELWKAGETDGGPRLALYVAGLAATLLGVVIATRAARRALETELRGS